MRAHHVYLFQMSDKRRAEMEPYSRHVLVCTGSFCSPDRRGRQIYSLLADLLQREDMLFGPERVKRGETPCLGVCSNGPIVEAHVRTTATRGDRNLDIPTLIVFELSAMRICQVTEIPGDVAAWEAFLAD